MWQKNGEGQPTKKSHDDIAGFLGKSATMRGTFTYEGTMRVDGCVEGEIITEGTLIVGEGGLVRADIKAAIVVCGGSIEGNVLATERVQLLAPSNLTGMVRSPLLIIEEGAQFNGTCEMKEKSAQAQAKPKPQQPAHIAPTPSQPIKQAHG